MVLLQGILKVFQRNRETMDSLADLVSLEFCLQIILSKMAECKLRLKWLPIFSRWIVPFYRLIDWQNSILDTGQKWSVIGHYLPCKNAYLLALYLISYFGAFKSEFGSTILFSLVIVAWVMAIYWFGNPLISAEFNLFIQTNVFRYASGMGLLIPFLAPAPLRDPLDHNSVHRFYQY